MSATDAVVDSLSTTFTCTVCGAFSMRVSARSKGRPDPADPAGFFAAAGALVDTETPIGHLGTAVSELDDPGAVTRAISTGDVAALSRMDLELVPLWCRACDATYCADHIRWWPIYEEESEFFDECACARHYMTLDYMDGELDAEIG